MIKDFKNEITDAIIVLRCKNERIECNFRFVGLGTLPMQAPELAVQEIKRAAGKEYLKENRLNCQKCTIFKIKLSVIIN